MRAGSSGGWAAPVLVLSTLCLWQNEAMERPPQRDMGVIDLTRDDDAPPPQKKRKQADDAAPRPRKQAKRDDRGADRLDVVLRAQAQRHGVAERCVRAAKRLLVDEQCTVPFVARYRAAETGHLPPAALRAVEAAVAGAAALEKRRAFVVGAIGPAHAAARVAAQHAASLEELEQIYAPFKGQRCTLAAKARAAFAGADAAAEAALAGGPRGEDAVARLRRSDRAHAAVVLAELVAKDPRARDAVARAFDRGRTAAAPGPERDRAFRDYEGLDRPTRHVSHHAWLALRRAAEAKALKVSLSPDRDDAAAAFKAVAARDLGPQSRRLLRDACDDAWTRLLKPRGKREALKRRVDAAKVEAVGCFASNVKHLLLGAPLPSRGDAEAVVVALDPGFAHGHKGAVVRVRDGACVGSFVVAKPPSDRDGPSDPRWKACADALETALRPYAPIVAVAVGDGANSRGCQRLVARLELPYAVVRECGASTYSATDLAAEELPGVPLERRGAASLARRLLDPLSEYVKLDPTTLGAGRRGTRARRVQRRLVSADFPNSIFG